MKNILNLFSAVICGLVLAFTTGASAQDIKQGVATVVRIQGEASYTLESGPNAKWIPLVAGKIVQAGATIRTEPGAMVDVVLGKQIQMPQAQGFPNAIGPAPDSLVRGTVDFKPSVEQNVIRLSGGTTLKIDKLTVSDTGVDAVSDTELDLKHGKIFFSVKKLSTSSQYLIKIPNGIAGVRGTKGSIDEFGHCWALQHSVWLSMTGPDGLPITVEVTEGHGFNPQDGQIITLPQDILDTLRDIGIAVDTLYYEVIQVTTTTSNGNDKTIVVISPVHGNTGEQATAN
jgi:FecR protein